MTSTTPKGVAEQSNDANQQPHQNTTNQLQSSDDNKIPNSTTNGATTTPPGFNKRCRDQAKLCLLVTSSFLLANANGMALWSAGASLFCLQRAKFWSTKNMKWSTLALISKGVAGFGYYSANFGGGTTTAQSMLLYSSRSSSNGGAALGWWMAATHMVSGAWGVVLGCFLASTYIQQHGLPEGTSEYVASCFRKKADSVKQS